MKGKLLVLTTLAAAATGGFYLNVDAKVERHLKTRGDDKRSMVYSDTFRLASGTELSPEVLRQRLEGRNYVRVETEPASPGEYRLGEDTLEVVTRPYRSADGAEVRSVRATYNFATGEVRGKSDHKLRAFSLEPVPLATLGSGEVRAKSYRNLKGLPPHVPEAFLAIEDRRFHSHFGIDPLGIARAMAENVRARRFVAGGSTLTQQLAKNVLFTPRKTLGRKIMEMFAALSLERRLTKDQILDLYLNEIYFSQEGSVAIHGVPEAASTFFGKDVSEITLSEAALLAGMVQAPSYYSPRSHYDRAIERRNVVLGEMLEQGKITKERYEEAKREKVKIVEAAQHRRNAPYYVATLERELASSFNIEAAPAAGVGVYTGIDVELQRCAEAAVTKGVERLKKDYPALRRKGKPIEAALVAIEPFSGVVRAWVGGSDFSTNQFDHVNQARRQIGSTIKPFLYLTAMDPSLNDYKVATATSILSDEPTGITVVKQMTWTPENYDHKYRGDVTLRYALEHSLNIPAVYVAQRVGIPAIVSTAKRFRLGDDIPSVPAIALGAIDTTLLRLTGAYGALANGGIYVLPRLFLSALDPEGAKLAESQVYEERVLDDGVVYVLTDMLRGVVERGTAAGVRRAGFRAPAAGKTGTSDDSRDAWFVGFTPNLVAGVWTGFDDNKKTGLTGGTGSVPIWADFMTCAEAYLPAEQFIAPPSVVSVAIDRNTLSRATEYCPRESVVTELFVRGTEPRRECPAHLDAPAAPEVYDDYNPGRERLPSGDERARPRRGFWDRLFGR